MKKITTKEEFKNLSGINLVDFYADWCGPCKMIAPVLEDLEAERKDINIIKVDVDSAQSLASEQNVMSIPTLMIVKDGKILDQKSGFMPKKMLNMWIDEHAK